MMRSSPDKTRLGATRGLRRGIRWLALVFALLAGPAGAVQVENLYQASVPVASRGDETERRQAFSAAMREVLVKVTGSTEVLNMAPLRRAVNNPQSYVESYSYRTIDNPTSEDEEEEAAEGRSIEVEVSFYDGEIRALLNANNIPIWPGNRPVTLVWAVIRDELGERRLMDSGMRTEVIRRLREEAGYRGMPLLLPLMDLEDMQVISADDVWDMNQEVIREASRRYQAESILVVRIFRALTDEHVGRYLYLFRERSASEQLYAETLEKFLEQPIDTAARELSGYYGMLLSGTNTNVVVKMTVEGIASPGDYAGLVKYVQGLANVNRYSITRVNGQTVQLELVTGGQLRQLVETIALDDDLMPLSEVTRQDNEVAIRYRWRG